MNSCSKILLVASLFISALAIAEPAQNKAEVKTLVDLQSVPELIRAFNLDQVNPLNRTIYFFDTPELNLFKSGGIIRLRVAEDKSFDSTVKIRPLDEDQVLDQELISKKGFKCETDASFSTAASSCSYTKDYDSFHAENTLRDQLGKKQSQFLEDQLEINVKLNGLIKLGPIESTCFKNLLMGNRYYSVESWKVGEETFVEISTKGDTNEIEEMRQDLKQLLDHYHIETDKSGTQKTTRALQILTRSILTEFIDAHLYLQYN